VSYTFTHYQELAINAEKRTAEQNKAPCFDRPLEQTAVSNAGSPPFRYGRI
jgi:hypothetical protein